MRIALKLFASLTDHLPPERKGNRAEIEVAEGTTIADVVTRYKLPEKSVHLVLVNGVFIPPGRRTAHALADGDELAIWPPIAGG